MTLLEKCYRALQHAGLDVRLADEHMGKCTAPYAVVYEGAQEGVGRTIGYRHILIDLLVPKDGAARLNEETSKVRAAMTDTGMFLYYVSSTSVLEDYDALSVAYDYRALCAL